MKVWVTKDGKKIPYDQLTIPHILNIIKYAKNYGFYSRIVHKSIVDNADDVTTIHDISREIIVDMYEELSRRKKTKI